MTWTKDSVVPKNSENPLDKKFGQNNTHGYLRDLQMAAGDFLLLAVETEPIVRQTGEFSKDSKPS